jgi:hypothetical protein
MALSRQTEAEAERVVALAQVDLEERRVLGRCLAAYDAAEQDYEGFCRKLGEPQSEALHRLFGTVHLCYMLVWKRYGRDRLDQMIGLGSQGLYLAGRKR